MAPKFTAQEKANEARRELAMRRKVFGRNPGADRQRQIAMMEEIVDDYQAQVPPPPQRSLFGERDD